MDEELETKIGAVMCVHMDANKPLKLFSIISVHFWPFPLRSTSSLGLFDHAVSVWSEAVCGGFCGQQRSPALAGVFRRQERGAFFMPLTACIVPLWTGLSKSFLCCPRLRNWGTVNKKNFASQFDLILHPQILSLIRAKAEFRSIP